MSNTNGNAEVRERTDSTLPLVLAAVGHIIWGLGFLFTRMALQVGDTDLMLSSRFVIAALLMTVLVMTGRVKVSFRGKRWKAAILLMIMQLVYYYFESYSILCTNATISGVVLAVVPVATVVLAMVFLREFPTRRQAIFCLVPVVGVIIMTVSGSSLGIVQPIGVVMLLVTCLSSSAYNTANRKAAEDFTSFERNCIVLLVSAVAFTAKALHTANGDLAGYLQPLANPAFLLPVLTLSVLSSVGANLMVNYAFSRMPVVKVSSFGSLSTLCSMFAGVIVLHEPMNLSLFVGAALILIGIREVTKG